MKLNNRMLGRTTLVLLAYLFLGNCTIMSANDDSSRLELSGAEVQKQTKRTITGIVYDAGHRPLVGVGIREKGTHNGVVTDLQGRYTITVKSSESVLIFSYLGFKDKELKVGGKKTLDVYLEEALDQLEEVVVVGYGVQKRVNLTGALTTVNSKPLENRPITQASQALQGLSSGVYVNTKSGEAGNDESSIVIRGVGSLNQSSSPLVLIDGIQGSLNSIAPSDIENVTVLKDASAASIYGTRGAKGVILVTTKRGKSNRPASFSYRNYYGISNPTVIPDMVINNRVYLEMYRQAAINSKRKFKFDDDDIEYYANRPATDRRKIGIKNNALIENHEFSVKGGTNSMRYFVSLGMLNQDGWLAGGQNFKRYTNRLNLDLKLSEKSSLGTSMSYMIKNAHLTPKDKLSVKSSSSKGSTVFSSAIVGHPFTPVLTESGYYANLDESLGIERNRPNILGIIENEKGRLDQTALIGSIFYKYEITEGLTAKATLGINRKTSRAFISKKEYQAHDQRTEEALGNSNAWRNRGSVLYVKNGFFREYTNILQLNYKKSWGGHQFKALLGYNRQVRRTDESEIQETMFGSKDLVFLGNGTSRKTKGINNERSSLLSYFTRINYTYKGIYLLEANLRRDASSRFGSNNRWGSFPSFSAGWVVSKEDFWPEKSLINYLKIRGSWGILGSEPGDKFSYLTEFQLGENYLSNSGGALRKLGNPDLKWEETENTNIGFNIGLLKNNLTIESDYFIRKTSDILVGIANPFTSGVSGKTTYNAAAMQNKGWEAAINYERRHGDFKFSIGANVTHVKNKVTTINPDLPNQADRIEISRANNIWWIRGEPINVIYGHQFDGVFQKEDFKSDGALVSGLDYSFIGTPKPGDIKYTDQNGDGVIDLKDRVVLGNRNPEWYYGINLNFSYKGIELSALLQGTGDAYVNLARETGPFPFAGLRSYWLEAWTPEKPSKTIPRVWVDRRGFNGSSIEKSGKYNSFWMKNVRYARLKNIQLAYNIPRKVLAKSFFSSARIFLNGQNLFTITPLKDFDPERNPLENHATATLPQSKIVSMGVNLTF